MKRGVHRFPGQGVGSGAGQDPRFFDDFAFRRRLEKKFQIVCLMLKSQRVSDVSKADFELL